MGISHPAAEARLTARGTNPAERAAAARYIHRHAHDPADAQHLLDALGLDTPDKETDQ